MPAASIAVFRALQLGDMLCAVPALRALRNAYPQADITLIGLPWARAFQQRFSHYANRFIAFPGYPGLPEATPAEGAVEAFLATARAQRFDLALQLHGCGPTSNEVVGKLGARVALGLGRAPSGSPVQLWPYPEGRHETRRLLALLEQALGLDVSDARLEFPLRDEDRGELRRHPELHAELHAEPGRPYVCLHPGARDVAKRWPAADFARVGDALAARGWRVMLTGCGAERGLAQQVAARMQYPACNAACDISVGGLAALLSGASLVVSNDTGAAHLCTALAVPSVVVFFATDVRRWGPPDNGRHRIAGGQHRPSADEVIAIAEDLLQRMLPRRPDLRRDTAGLPMT